MRGHAELSGVKRISLLRNGCGLDQLNWSEMESLIKDVFKRKQVAIAVYVVPQQSPILNCETDVEEVGSRKGERPSLTPSSSDYNDDWFDRNQKSELRKFKKRGLRSLRHDRSKKAGLWSGKRGAAQPDVTGPYKS